MKPMKEGERISLLVGEGISDHATKLLARRRVVSKEEGIRKTAELLQKINPAKEKESAEKFVAEAKQKAQPVVEARRGWASEHRYATPQGVTSQEHLDKIKDILQALRVSANPELIQIVGVIDPNTLQSPQAAEFIARLAVVPQSLREDPNYLFSEAAKLVASKDLNLTSGAHSEIDAYLNKTILRIRDLKQTKSFLMNDEELTYSLRGLVLYDEELDAIESDSHLRGVLLKNVRRLKALPNLSADQEKNVLLKMRERVESGEVQEIGGGRREFHTYDPLDATKYLQRITRRIEGLDRTIDQERSFVGWEPKDASEAMLKIGANLRTRNLTTDELEALKPTYESLSKEEQSRLKAGIEIKVRKLISELEEEPEDRWQRGHIASPQQQELGGWLNVLKQIDAAEWKQFDDEEQGRNWLHQIIKAMEKGESPFATKNLLAAQQGFDKMEFHERIAKLPGVSKVYQLLDEKYEEYFRSEMNPEEKKAFELRIIDEIRHTGVCNTQETGVTPEDAFRVGYRHWKEVGREGWMYRTFIRKNNLVVIKDVKASDGKMYPKAVVDQNTPLLWDPMRVIYCPEALWFYFGFGSYRGGEPVKMINFNGRPIATVGARGVGADVLKKLFEGNIDFLVQDYYARRKGLILQGWISQELDKLRNLPPTDPTYQKALEDQKAWYAELENVRKGDPLRGVRADPVRAEVYELQQKVLKAEYNVRFADRFHTHVWETPFSDESAKEEEKKIKKTLDKIDKLKEREERDRNRQDILDVLIRLKSDIPRIVNDTNTINNRIQERRYRDNIALEYQGKRLTWKEDPTFSESFITEEGFDISQISFLRTPRLQENVRGNFRDHFTALTVAQTFGDFINDPKLEHLMKIPVAQAKGYTAWQNIQARMIVPAYNAFVDVHRGRGPLGGEFFGLLKSKYGLIFDVAPIDDRELYKIRRKLVTEQFLDKDMARKLGVIFTGPLADPKIQDLLSKIPLDRLAWIGDKTLEHVDPMMLQFAIFAYISAQLQELMKEQQKE